MGKILTVFVLSLVFFGCSKQRENLIFNVHDLVGKDDKGVAAVLGQPDSSYYKNILGHRYFIQRYKSRDTEVRHFKGHVAEVIVNKPYDLPFDQHTIERFGLGSQKPTSIDTNAMIIWKDIPDFKSVTLYKTGAKKSGALKVQFKIFFNFD